MSIKAMSVVWESRVESSKKFILLYYADRGNDEGENIWPAVRSVAKMTSLSRRTVQRLTKEMVDDGLLVPDGSSKHGTNRYKIILDLVRDYEPKIKPEDEDDDPGPNKSEEQTEQPTGDTVTPPVTMSLPPCQPDTPPVSPCHPLHDTMTPEPLFNHPLTASLTKDGADAPKREKPEKKGDWLDCLLAYQKPTGEVDISYFPEDCRLVVQEFCRLWQVPPPRKESKSMFKLWIKDCRLVNQACGEFGISLVERYFTRWQNEGRKLTISRPGSLINMLYSEASLVRQDQSRTAPADQYDPVAVANFQAALKASRQST